MVRVDAEELVEAARRSRTTSSASAPCFDSRDKWLADGPLAKRLQVGTGGPELLVALAAKGGIDAGLDSLRCSGSAAMTPGQLDQRHRVADRFGQYLLPALAAWRARLLIE